METPTETTKPVGRWWISPHGTAILKRAFQQDSNLFDPRGMYANDLLSKLLNAKPFSHDKLLAYTIVIDRCFHPQYGYIAWQEFEAAIGEGRTPVKVPKI